MLVGVWEEPEEEEVPEAAEEAVVSRSALESLKI